MFEKILIWARCLRYILRYIFIHFTLAKQVCVLSVEVSYVFTSHVAAYRKMNSNTNFRLNKNSHEKFNKIQCEMNSLAAA